VKQIAENLKNLNGNISYKNLENQLIENMIHINNAKLINIDKLERYYDKPRLRTCSEGTSS
jgi:hypothetical protein